MRKNDLKLLLMMQRKFQNKFGMHPALKDVASALTMEGTELWEASKGKWWSKKTYSREKRLEEAIDVLHFWLLYCTESGFTAEEIFKMYCSKLAENYRRQKRGY